MKRFLAVYLGSAQSAAHAQWNSLDEKTRHERTQAGMKAWSNWAEKNQAAIVDHGAPLGKTKRAATNGLSDVTNLMTAYTIVQAESHEAAAKLFLEHPHFMIFPGDSIEIMECLPMPQG